MLAESDSRPLQRLQAAVVLEVTEDGCTVTDDGEVGRFVAFADFFPRPRVDRVSPGNLVALACSVKAGEVIVWRWFDAVVMDQNDDHVMLWEQFHGVVKARRRDPLVGFSRGARAYASSGLPGSEWWVVSSVVARPDDAVVEFDEVEAFLTAIGQEALLD